MKIVNVKKDIEISISWDELINYNSVLKRVVNDLFENDDKKALDKLQKGFNTILIETKGW